MSSKNAVPSQQRSHGGDNASSAAAMAESTYANSDAISSFYSMQQKPPLARPLPSHQQQQQGQASVAGEYASLCIAMSSPVDHHHHHHQNSMTTSQARLRPALFRLSDGFDYDLANPVEQTIEGKLIGEDHRHNNINNNNNNSNNNIPRNNSSNTNNRNSLSLNTADLESATAMLDQVAGAGPVTYGEYASTAIALEPLTAVESATGFADPCAGYTSEEDELDESETLGMAFRYPPVSSTTTTSTAAAIGGVNSGCHHHHHHHHSQNQSHSQNSRSLPVVESSSVATTTTTTTSGNGITDENRPNNFLLPVPPQTLSTFSSSSNGHTSTSAVPPSRVRQTVKSETITTSTTQQQQQPASPAASSSLTTAGSGLQALKVRRQMIEAALSGGSGSVATPVIPSIPPSNNNGNGAQQQQQQKLTVETSNNNGCSGSSSNSQQLSSGQQQQQQQQQQQRKDVGHLDMSQYSNLEGKVLVGGKATATNVTAKSSSFQETKLLTKVPPTTAPVSDGGATVATTSAPATSANSHRNKVLTSSSRKGRGGASKEPSDSNTGARFDPTTDADQAAPMPTLPITELSERLAREAKALAGRRSLVLSANNPVLSTSTTAHGRQPATLPATSSSSNPASMSQSMHAGPANNNNKDNTNNNESKQQQPQTMPTMLDVCRYHGQIRWTKIIENGKRIKKAWTIYYCVFVTSPPRLFFFKDEKAAQKSPPPAAGNLLKPTQELSVPSPWSVCSQSDLPTKLQFTRRKNVLFLAVPNSTNSSTSSSASNNNSSPPLSDQAPGFPDVAVGYLVEGPNTEQTEIWLKHFLQFGGLSKYSAGTLSSSPPPPVPRETLTQPNNNQVLSNNGADSLDVTAATTVPTTTSATSNSGVATEMSASSKSAAVAAISRATRPSGSSSNPGAKGSLMKLLTGFFKRRPTMEHLKKKGYIRDTVFGSSLDNICRRERSEVPSFVTACVGEIEARGLDTDGLYRTSGNLAQVQKLRCMVDQGQPIVWDKWEIAVLTGALKMFFRELREPLIAADVYEKLTEYATRPDLRRSLDPVGRESYLRRCLSMLPPIHFSTARFLFGHFVHVLEHSSSNRMELQSLAIVVAPNLMAPHTDVRSVAAHALLQKYIAEDLIQFYYNVFFNHPPNDSHLYANSIAAINST